ncbi:MAG: 30S ribosome-binding factor RbfA [Xanthomonadales bacterium]|nr:30S ribosome-binding factor RbfA [Xanthomonadales bacterium]
MEFSRHERLAGLLRREIATLIWGELKDPRIGSLTVTDVEVTPDLSLARVYVASANSDGMAQSLKVLQGAGGFLRRRLGRLLSIRAVPELRFYHDDSMDRGDRIDHLLHQVLPEPQDQSDPDTEPGQGEEE